MVGALWVTANFGQQPGCQGDVSGNRAHVGLLGACTGFKSVVEDRVPGTSLLSAFATRSQPTVAVGAVVSVESTMISTIVVGVFDLLVQPWGYAVGVSLHAPVVDGTAESWR